MKFSILIHCLLLAFVFYSCQPTNPQPNPNSSSTSNTHWKIKVTSNGVTHHAEGNTFDLNQNFCYTTGLLTGAGPCTISAKINDTNISSYISGDPGSFTLNLNSPHLGVNLLEECTLMSTWLYPANMSTSGGYSLSLNGPMVPNTLGSMLPLPLKIPITIDEMGSPGAGNYITFGNCIKGKFNDTLYFRNTSNGNFNIPVAIKIEFEALRL